MSKPLAARQVFPPDEVAVIVQTELTPTDPATVVAS